MEENDRLARILLEMEDEDRLVRILLASVSNDTFASIQKELWEKYNSIEDLLEKAKILRILNLITSERLDRFNSK